MLGARSFPNSPPAPGSPARWDTAMSAAAPLGVERLSRVIREYESKAGGWQATLAC